MRLYRTTGGAVLENQGKFVPIEGNWDEIINTPGLQHQLSQVHASASHSENARSLTAHGLLPPVANQEIWGAGVTYKRSVEARMDEAKDAGGGDFYDRVYNAVRPELFFKALGHRTAGSGQYVRIRRDAQWNVPEPEFTLCINNAGEIVGHTIGNDMSARDIEGENPLYLPQAKTYDYSAGLGPCIFISKSEPGADTTIVMDILRNGIRVFAGATDLGQMKRSFAELVSFLVRECSFPWGCMLMTGTGIIPPDDFTLHSGDEIRISVKNIGTLINYVE